MTVKKFGFLLIAFTFFIILLLGEYLYCSMNYRLVRSKDLWGANIVCSLLSIGICYLYLKNLIKEAIKENIAPWIILVTFLIFIFLFGSFLRLNLQIANGLFDKSDPDIKIAVVTRKDTSVFGASIKDGLSAMAYYIYFADWDDKDKNCELLIHSTDYYFLGQGSSVKLAVHDGFFHLPWVEDYRTISP